MPLSQQVNFTGVASDDLAVSFSLLEAAVAELEAQAAAPLTTSAFNVVSPVIKSAIARHYDIRVRLDKINRG